MITSVMRALRDSGDRKTLTPLEMASVPVSAEPPEANAFITTNSDAPSSRPCPGVPTEIAPAWCSEWGWRSPRTALTEPTMMSSDHVGDEEIGRDGEGPARLADAAQVAVGDEHDEADGDPHRAVVRPRLGKTDVNASTPAATDTATVSV